MKSKGKKEILTLLIVMFSFASISVAGLTELTESDHYQGTSYTSYNTGNSISYITLDFAVYDSQGSDGIAFVEKYGEVPGSGKYIYAYQLFVGNSIPPLDFFGLIGIEEGALGGNEDENIFTMESSSGTPGAAVDADDAYVAYSKTYEEDLASWDFGEIGNGSLTAGKHSYLLILRSDNTWKTGDYTFDRTALNTDPPIATPEPCTVALLGFGGLAMLRRRKKH